MTCPQCGEPTETLHEGYCADCCTGNQARLDAHNAQFDAWEKMTDQERAESIQRSADEAEREYREREMEQLDHDGQLCSIGKPHR